MYLSTLLIDTGTNPDRPRPGRLWLRNRYRVHQRLCMAFPSRQRANIDAAFLTPYDPGDFSAGQVHVPRNDDGGFLFRVDPLPNGRAVILVLSAIEPDWDYAFQNAFYFLAARPQTRAYAPVVVVRQQYRFRLAANAVFRARARSLHRSGRKIDDRWVGKRIGVPGDEASLRGWIDRHAARAGFVVRDLPVAQAGYVYVNKTGKAGNGQRLRSAQYEGILEVTDPGALDKALRSGIGPAKAFGFGLLSIAPAQ